MASSGGGLGGGDLGGVGGFDAPCNGTVTFALRRDAWQAILDNPDLVALIPPPIPGSGCEITPADGIVRIRLPRDVAAVMLSRIEVNPLVRVAAALRGSGVVSVPEPRT